MLLTAEHLSIHFGIKPLLTDVNFYLEPGDKYGIIGINGTGKSTFLKVLAGQLEPDAGKLTRQPNAQISFLSQNPVMEDSATVLEQVFLHFPPEFRQLSEHEAKSMLTQLGLTDFDQKIGTLSGGQRKRVALVSALVHPADILILAESIWEITGTGSVECFTGNWSDWDRKRREESAPKAEKPKAAPERTKVKKLRFSYQEEREFSMIDHQIAQLEAAIAENEAAQAACGADFVKLQQLQQEQEVLQEKLEERTQRWMYLTELKEKIDAQ